MISCRDVSPNLKNTEKRTFLKPEFIRHAQNLQFNYLRYHSTSVFCPSPTHSLLSQRLLLIDANVEVHWLDPQQHAALDLPRQRVEHGSRQRDANVEAVPVPCDDRQHVGGGAAGGLGHLNIT